MDINGGVPEENSLPEDPGLKDWLEGLDTDVLYDPEVAADLFFQPPGAPRRVVETYPNGQMSAERWVLPDGTPHRDGGPATRTWWPNGQLASELWKVDGYMHRTGGPAEQRWYVDGTKSVEAYWEWDTSHRVGGPAEVVWHTNGVPAHAAWRWHDFLHNEQGPALAEWDEAGTLRLELHYADDELHNRKGPAWRCWDADAHLIQEEWYVDGLRQPDPGDIATNATIGVPDQALGEHVEAVHNPIHDHTQGRTL